MFMICLYTADKGWTEVVRVSGDEVVAEAYLKACELAELVGAICVLADALTGEIVESSIQKK